MLPEKPGIYQFISKGNETIYVGKAKNLKKRVASYFVKNQTGKTEVMIGKTESIKHMVVETESDALLLENSLIKKLQPRYNLQLKDDKTFPWICIKNEPYPRVFHTRNKINDDSRYFGPYTSMVMVRTLLEMIKKIYPIRNCKYNLTPENIKAKKFKVCLEYHMENCKGPCVGLQGAKEYKDNIDQIEEILKGNIHSVVTYLQGQMKKYSSEYQYEEANYIKEKIEILKRYQSKSVVVSPTLGSLDIFSYVQDETHAYVNYLKVSHGAVIQAHTVELKKKLDESREEILPFAITEIRQRMFSHAKEIVVPFKIDLQLPGIRTVVPRKGDKMKLLELSKRNATYYRLEKNKKKLTSQVPPKAIRILNKLAQDLRLKEIPVRIECMDNSNIQGKTPVSACVVFHNARPSKSNYRHYNIKTVKKADDFASFSEVVTRRYTRLLKEKKPLPQLLIIDGGKGQLSAASKSLEEMGLKGKIAVMGIAKRLEEIYYPGDPVPLYLDKNSESLRLLQFIRNEAHRFGITFHRNKRSKEQINSILDEIDGVGEKTKQKLFAEFKTIENIKAATISQLMQCVGKSKAKTIHQFFKESV